MALGDYSKTTYNDGGAPGITASVLNKNENKVSELDAMAYDMSYKPAGGTATAITITIKGTLKTGYPVCFTAAADNGGAASTLNGYPIYRPGSTSPVTIKANKPISLVFNEAGSCFFFKASAEGTATAGDVLSGVTFSNNEDTGIAGTLALTGDTAAANVLVGKSFYSNDAKTKRTGTMPNRAGDTTCLSSAIAGTTLKLLPSDGYRDGIDDYVTLTDAEFIATNIRKDINLFGLVGTLIEGDVFGSNPKCFLSFNGTQTTATQLISVTGSGWIISYQTSTTSQVQMAITVDGTQILPPSGTSMANNGNTTYYLFYRFLNGFTINVSSTSGQHVNYLLG